MSKLTDYSNDLAKLTELRSDLISERDKTRREIENIRHKAAQLVLERADIGTLAEQKAKLELVLEANIAAIEILDVRIRNARELLEAEQRAQEAESQEIANAQERSW